ncbi:MAG: hypothetical protein IKM53_05555 [Clostridia bacterium]|nr:hypothetical protein [Clostridia bacterium]
MELRELSSLSLSDSATSVEPLEQIIDELKKELRSRHTVRLQQGLCSIELGFVWADILTNLERVSDHCSNIAGCVLETTDETLELHRSVRAMKNNNSLYEEKYRSYAAKYLG